MMRKYYHSKFFYCVTIKYVFLLEKAHYNKIFLFCVKIYKYKYFLMTKSYGTVMSSRNTCLSQFYYYVLMNKMCLFPRRFYNIYIIYCAIIRIFVFSSSLAESLNESYILQISQRAPDLVSSFRRPRGH